MQEDGAESILLSHSIVAYGGFFGGVVSANGSRFWRMLYRRGVGDDRTLASGSSMLGKTSLYVQMLIYSQKGEVEAGGERR